MRYLLLLMIAAAASGRATAQYAGGPGDGHDFTEARQSLPPLIRFATVFAGGAGDGHDFTEARQSLPPLVRFATVFSGGAGDGHDFTEAQRELPPLVRFAAVFSGGAGDGYAAIGRPGDALPLTLLDFWAEPADKAVELDWVTTDERDTDRFDVQRSADGLTFHDIGRVTAAGESRPGESVRYAFRDAEPAPGLNYYRLRMRDLDGSYTLSPIRTVHFGAAADAGWHFRVSPNPLRGGNLRVDTDGLTGPAAVTIRSVTGAVVFARTYAEAEGGLDVVLGRSLPAGSYVVSVTDAAGVALRQWLMVN